MSSFVHLHVHSEYSLLDGACRVDDLCRRSADEGSPGIALTDHGVMFGAVDFYDTSRKYGLTPIIGCEAYIAPRGRFDRTVRDEAHITLLAASDEGYKNLTALISKGFLEGYYYKPRIDMDLLAQHHAGLIVLSGCMSGLVAAPLLKSDRAASKKNAQMFADIFGDRFYIEIMRHGMPEEDVINDGLISIARELSLPLVATNDSHYLSRGDAQAHDVLLCIGTGKTVADTSRMKFFSDEFYVKSPHEMRELFADVPEACDNTLEIVKRIDIKIPEKVFYLPDYPVPKTAAEDIAGVLAGALAVGGIVEAIGVGGSYGTTTVAGDGGALTVAGDGGALTVAGDGGALTVAGDGAVLAVAGDGAVLAVGAQGGTLAFAKIGTQPDIVAAGTLVRVGHHRMHALGSDGGSPVLDGGAAAQAVGHAGGGARAVEMSADDYLRLVCEKGLIERYGVERAKSDAELRERLVYELGVIIAMGFASYFLIVWDFIKFARDSDIPVGPGRGSAVGSLVAYCLKITDLDPLKFGLIFERFLNPDRISMPDIDTDFCVERRDEVIAYVTKKYGKDRVAQIVTFGTMAARAAIRDAGRALAVPLPDVDRVAKLIPSGPGGLSIAKALEQIPELKALYDVNPQIRRLIDTASSIEGLARHASTHAAGVVISKNPLIEHVPLVRIGDGDVNTQYEMGDVERVGLLKMDFLGLRNLTVMKSATDEIRRTTDPGFDLATIRDDDARTYEMLGRGETLGVFQLESEGMRRVCIDLKPSTLADIIALVALYRPGPMDWIPQYINNKHGRTKPTYLHPKLVAILGETYGIACLRVGTPVWCVDGTVKPIQDVQAGDAILSYDAPSGAIREGVAAKVWPSGSKPLLRITLSTGKVIECSEDHRFPTPAGDRFARDLRPHQGPRKKNYLHRAPESVLFEAWQPSKNDWSLSVGMDRAYVLGLLLGDGCLKVRGSRDIACATRADAEFVARVSGRAFACDTNIYQKCGAVLRPSGVSRRWLEVKRRIVVPTGRRRERRIAMVSGVSPGSMQTYVSRGSGWKVGQARSFAGFAGEQRQPRGQRRPQRPGTGLKLQSISREQLSGVVHFDKRAWYVAFVCHTAPRSTPLTRWFDEIYGGPMWCRTSTDRSIPTTAIDWPEQERVALLRALWDIDGNDVAEGQYYRSTSPLLCRQVGTLLSSLKIAFRESGTMVAVQDHARFIAILGSPLMPSKRRTRALKYDAMPAFTNSSVGPSGDGPSGVGPSGEGPSGDGPSGDGYSAVGPSGDGYSAVGASAVGPSAVGPSGFGHSAVGHSGSARLLSDPILRRGSAPPAGKAETKAASSSAYLMRIPGLGDAYGRSYEELYLGDSRPVYIDSIVPVGTDECFDLQMADQSSPYFIANGVVTHNCYQEQIMQIARDVAGFTMGQADELRKVMGKKQKEKIPVYREKFIAGAAIASGIDAKLADEIFAFVEPFAGYGFNKSHAAAYGWIAYQTAFLKANHPVAYFAALMTSVRDKTDKLVEYIDEAKKLGVAVLPPDINESLVDFAVVGSQIRFGLAAVKGIGAGAVRAILQARQDGKFVDFFDCVRRVDPKALNRKVYEALIKCGAFDTLPGNRAQLLDALDSALEGANRAARDREVGQFSLFGEAQDAPAALTPALRPVAPPSTLEALAWEKETLGIFVSGHPLSDVAEALVRGGAAQVKDLRTREDDAPVRIAGLVTAVRRTMTKAQSQMLIATVEDMSGAIEVVVFPKQYPLLQGFFTEDAIIIIDGRLRLRERRGSTPGEETPIELSVTANDVSRFERGAAPPKVSGWHVRVTRKEHIDDLAVLLAEWPGTVPLTVHINGETVLRSLAASSQMRTRLAGIVGAANVREGPP